MQPDIVDLIKFYNSPLGSTVQALLSTKVSEFWSDFSTDRLLGLGYATPLLDDLEKRAERTFAFMPSGQGVAIWPELNCPKTALIDEANLPLAEASVDKVLAIHSLEMAANPAELLSELWRVLTPGGKLLLIVPSRSGVWARTDISPFGFGTPFSKTQLQLLLTNANLTPNRWDRALFMPPAKYQFVRKGSARWERFGARFFRAIAGVIVVEANKNMSQAIPAGKQLKKANRFQPVLVPMANKRRR